MLFLALVMMPFTTSQKLTLSPGYLKLRFGESSRTLSSVSFAFMTVLMSGINMYSMALVLKIVLGWDINVSIWISAGNRRGLCGSGRLAFRHFQRSPAVHLDLGWCTSYSNPRID